MPNNVNVPVGQRFDQVYIERGAPVDDSQRMRRRLGAVFNHLQYGENGGYHGELQRALGVRVPYGMGGVNGEEFFVNAELRDVLTSITIIWGATSVYRKSSWLQDVETIFREENMCYRVDERGGVHYTPDEEYERNRVAAVSALSPGRYSAAALEFEKAQKALTEQPPDGKAGIRGIFEAIEVVFKLICADANRLSENQIRGHLQPIIEAEYSGSNAEKKAALKLCDSLKDWVNGAHEYRHGQAEEAPRSPPLGLAVLMMSSGAAFLRWLAELDQSRRQ